MKGDFHFCRKFQFTIKHVIGTNEDELICLLQKSLLNFDEINEGIKSLKETQNYCLTKKQILRREKCNGDDLRLLILDIFCTDAELFEAILNVAKQGKLRFLNSKFICLRNYITFCLTQHTTICFLRLLTKRQ